MSFPSKNFGTIEKLEIVHTNLCGHSRTRGFNGEMYFMILVDNFTRMMWVAFLKEKYEAFEKFKVFKSTVENEYGHYASKYPKREKKFKGRFRSRRRRKCLYANEEEDEFDHSRSED